MVAPFKFENGVALCIRTSQSNSVHISFAAGAGVTNLFGTGQRPADFLGEFYSACIVCEKG